MKYIPFVEYFPEVAEKETCTLIVPLGAMVSAPPAPSPSSPMSGTDARHFGKCPKHREFKNS
jgi:hypothetical protein